MRELEAITAQYDELKLAGTEAALATVVHVEGSSYRRAGARMLVDEFGNITGAISGGCLEGDALRKALHSIHHRKNKLVTYDTSDEDDAIIGAQLGCNGIIQVLFEYLDYRDDLNPCELLKTTITTEQKRCIVVQFSLNSSSEQRGTCLLVSEDLQVRGRKPEASLLHPILQECGNSFAKNLSRFVEISEGGDTQYFFIQNYRPPIKLIIVGAGNDAQILSRQTELLGWKVVVIDGRPTHASQQRFSASCQVIVTRPEETLAAVKMDSRSCVVLMSHNYHYDLAVLKLLIDRAEIPYIGILGPLKKYERMLKDLENDGFDLDKRLLEKIHAPVGLEIGAESPAEIGLSILAEIQIRLTRSSGRPLKEKKEPIHDKHEFRFKKILLSG